MNKGFVITLVIGVFLVLMAIMMLVLPLVLIDTSGRDIEKEAVLSCQTPPTVTKTVDAGDYEIWYKGGTYPGTVTLRSSNGLTIYILNHHDSVNDGDYYCYGIFTLTVRTTLNISSTHVTKLYFTPPTPKASTTDTILKSMCCISPVCCGMAGIVVIVGLIGTLITAFKGKKVSPAVNNSQPAYGAAPVYGSTTPPYGTGTAPGYGTGTAPGYGTGTAPVYGSTTPPYGTGTAPGYGTGTAPGYGTGTAPGYGTGTAPAYGTGQTVQQTPNANREPPTDEYL